VTPTHVCPAGHEAIPGALWTLADAAAWEAAHAPCTAPATATPPDPSAPLLALAARLSVPVQRYPGGVVCETERAAVELAAAARREGVSVARTGPIVAAR
jgi:hypothetical protein